MKLLLMILLTVPSLSAQGLNKQARALMKCDSVAFETTIMARAVDKWSGNYRMIVHEINQQSAAFSFLVKMPDNDVDILRLAMIKYSYADSDEQFNDGRKRKTYLEYNCNWVMVLHEFKVQTKAKKELKL